MSTLSYVQKEKMANFFGIKGGYVSRTAGRVSDITFLFKLSEINCLFNSSGVQIFMGLL